MRFKRYTVSMSPHVRQGRTIRSLVLTYLVALLPATLWGIYQFGWAAVLKVAVGVLVAVGTEWGVNRLAHRPQTIGDFHAVLVGLMVALLTPSGAPAWLVAVAALAAILVGKLVYGPLGGAPIPPAVVGMLIVILSWPQFMQAQLLPHTAPEAHLHFDPGVSPFVQDPQSAVRLDPSAALSYNGLDLFLGLQPGAVGTISPLLLLLGGLFLLRQRAARWEGPLGFLLGFGLAAAIAHGLSPGSCPSVGFQLFTGTAMFGAFFLVTEWSSSPNTPWGLFLYGLSVGALALVFRLTGHLPAGRTLFAVALVSLATPLFDRIAPTPFGKVVRHA